MLGFPPCFSSLAAFKAWKKSSKETELVSASSFCHDCTRSYQRQMIAENRCNYPDTLFVTLLDDEDGEMPPEEYVAGVRP